MSTDIKSSFSQEEIISIPSFLLSNYNSSRAGDCGQCNGCMAEMEDPCGNGEWCDECTCQGWEMCCQSECSEEDCEEDPYEECKEWDCPGEGCGTCLCTGGQGQYPCSQSCKECDACEDCMDCEDYCMGYETIYTIEQWDWEENENNEAAYEAITEKGPVTNFLYTVWNDMVGKVYAAREVGEKNPKWNSTYEIYEKTRMTPSDKTLTAKRFNSLWINIRDLKVISITERKPGNYVYGHYFITLMEKLNEYIADLQAQQEEEF